MSDSGKGKGLGEPGSSKERRTTEDVVEDDAHDDFEGMDETVDLSSFTYSVTQEGVLAAHMAKDLFDKHWAKVKRLANVPNNPAQYKMAILMDMAINGTSGKRSGDNFLLFGGARISTTYLEDIGVGEVLRRWGRAYYGTFLKTITQDNDEARKLLKILARKWGCSSAIAPYVVDFIDIMKVPPGHQLLAKTIAQARVRNGDTAVLTYLRHNAVEAAKQAQSSSAGGNAGGTSSYVPTAPGSSGGVKPDWF